MKKEQRDTPLHYRTYFEILPSEDAMYVTHIPMRP